MDWDVVRQKLNAIFQDIFDNTALEVTDTMAAPDVEGWDSLSHINLIVAVEKEFKIKMTTIEVRRLNNVGEFIGRICKKAAQVRSPATGVR